ncbi:MAG TPA: FG-GAP-like repeat-containing protein [Pyrinomonadaceae bacterium]|nr:FG-GAP-like repeat-containing protein [Pyrinomonadaceae bacterium]
MAALQVGDDVRADSKLMRLTQLVPDEPAGWANWGLLALRQRNFDAAAERLERARSLAPDNDQIYYLIGLLESDRGRSAEAIAALRRAIDLNPQNLRAIYHLAQEIERQGDANSEAEYQQLMQKILAAQPDNLAGLLELSRVAAKRGDADTLRNTVARISARSSTWPPEVQEQLNTVKAAAAGPDPRAAATRITFLRNVLVRVSEFRESLAAIKPPPGDEATPFTLFLKLDPPTFAAAPADKSLTFRPQMVANIDGSDWNWIGGVSLSSEGAPTVVVANGHEVRLASGASFPFPGGSAATAPQPEGILAIDFIYDFKTDLVLAGSGGVRLMRQDNPKSFTEVTSLAKLPASITTASYTGSWAADIEADGDLDIVLGSEKGSTSVLRNNGEGTFMEMHPFANVSGLRGFAWADLDADGDPDAALIDGEARLHVFNNERTGLFNERPIPASLASVRSVNVADANNDGVLDLLAVQADGVIVRLSDKNEGQSWEMAEVARVTNGINSLAGTVRLRVADIDNNGGLDLMLGSTAQSSSSNSGALVWLSDQTGNFRSGENVGAPARVFDTADLNGDGRLDLLGLADEGQPIGAINHGQKNYHWQVIRPRAKEAVGDQRINSFGVGGEMEIRSGLLVQKQPITGPLLHFGLGEQTGTDVVRIVWPNGSVRAEFELQADQEIAAEQRLKGSCPFLFAYNGRQMEFVKDSVPWSSAIGLRINTLGTARVEATEEWYKIGRDQLVARDGYYDLRVTGELWETYYYDHLALMIVDHPAGTEIFVDERFVIPPAKLAITTVATPRGIASAVDDQGQDVTSIVSTLDGNYTDTFGRGTYQGVTRDHYVEVDLGSDAPQGGPLWLIAQGWMHPTDSSINVAISQGQHEQAKGLSLEVPDGSGGWIVAHPNLGFPAGRKKICLFDLTNAFRPGTPRRLRLRTNLEVYWDVLEWAQGLPDAPVKTTRLNPDIADLHYRGYSVINQANDSSPEVPDYNQLAGSTQRWRDLVGYYTRFGDVRELLAGIDDRYVIMNAGDEMSFRFAAPAPPSSGWVRDYVIIGDGWIKDGDYNSTFSKTVQPLPYHAKQEYTTPPGRLEDEWVYRRYPEDWEKYHTRYVTPEVFRNALRHEVRK